MVRIRIITGITIWNVGEWNDSVNFKDVIIDFKNSQNGLESGNYVQILTTRSSPYGNQQAPLLSLNVGSNINYLLGLSLDVTVPTSPLINIGLNSNLLNSLGLGGLRLCLLNLIGINCSNSIENYVGAEDHSAQRLNHAQLMIEWED